ncbi:MAG: lyase family protein [Streptosporangiaceae bacterium]
MTSSDRDGLFSALFGRGAAGPDDAAWLQAMLDAEAGLARALERAGLAAGGSGEAVTAAARAGDFDGAEIGRQAARTGNPVPALVRALTARVPEPARAAVHQGATSQDILDTAMMLLGRRGLDEIGTSLAAAAAAAAGLAEAHAGTIMAGRTLLQQAVPVTFGLVAAGWLTALDESRQQLDWIRRERLAAQLGGAAGTLASLGDAGPAVAALFAAELGLARPALPWHTSRLRIADLAAGLAGACAAAGKIARDITLLAQSEVGEVREGSAVAEGNRRDQAGGDQAGGSSAMPHKRNPVAAVVILGCTRRAPGLAATLLAAGEQELQRAAGGWHAEWEPLAELLRLTGSAAAWSADLLAGLQVDPDRMRASLDAAGGMPMAERVAGLLAPAIGRLAAHDLVAEASREAAGSGRPLGAVLAETPRFASQLEKARIGRPELAAALDPASYLGGTGQFIAAALAAHRECEDRLARHRRESQ